jgi:hypothetical protein
LKKTYRNGEWEFPEGTNHLDQTLLRNGQEGHYFLPANTQGENRVALVTLENGKITKKLFYFFLRSDCNSASSCFLPTNSDIKFTSRLLKI